MNNGNVYSEELEHLKQNKLLREIPNIDCGWAKYIKINNRSFLNLASNNYLALAESPKLKHASIKSIKQNSCSSSASRLITGNYSVYDELENLLAQFKQTESALVFNSGYVANLSTISSLCSEDCIIFSDELNHASIIDGVKLSKAKPIVYKHSDMDHLKHLIKKHTSAKRKLIVTDSIFSMDGDIANIEDLVRIAKDSGSILMVDEAHATGVFGRGIVHKFKLEKEVDIQMGTFSKALGSFGAFIASTKEIISILINKARGFIYSTSLPPSVIAANKAAIETLLKNQTMGESLLKKSEQFRFFLKNIGFNTGSSSSQIIPIILGDTEKLFKAKEILSRNHIIAAFIRPPTVPKRGHRIRVSMRIDLTNRDIKRAKRAFKEVARALL